MKILKILILLCLGLFPFGEMLRFEVGNHIVLKPLDVIVGFSVVWWMVLILFERSKAKSRTERFSTLFVRSKNSILVPLISFSLIGLVALLINLTWLKPNEFWVALLYLVRWVSYAAMVGIVWQFDERFKKKLIVFLFFDGLIILVLGFLQYFFFNNLKSLYHLGWDDHMHRVFSVFFDPNFAGAFFVLFFLFVGGILESFGSNKKTYLIPAIFHPHPDPLPSRERETIRRFAQKYFLFLILLLTLIAVFLTFSRAALLMLIVGSVVFLILVKRKKLLLVFFAALLLYVGIASPKFYDENMNLFRVASSKARLANYSSALKIIEDRPLLGVGFNSYRYTKELYGLNHDWVKAPSHADAGVDNSFLFVMATTGAIGFIAYCSLLIGILKRAYYLYRKNKNILSVVVISSIAGLSVDALFINSLFFPAIMLWMWVLIGLMESK